MKTLKETIILNESSQSQSEDPIHSINQLLANSKVEYRAIKCSGTELEISSSRSNFAIQGESRILQKVFGIDTIICREAVKIDYHTGPIPAIRNIQLLHKKSILSLFSKTNKINLTGCKFTCGGLDLTAGAETLYVQDCTFNILYNWKPQPKNPKEILGTIHIELGEKDDPWTWKNNKIIGDPILSFAGADEFIKRHPEITESDPTKLHITQWYANDIDLPAYYGAAGDFGAVAHVGDKLGWIWMTRKWRNDTWLCKYIPY